jgi:LacI family transcriptional regulator
VFTPAPTLRDVARAAGVSHMTVLRALNDSPRVAPATAQKVRAVAQRLNYRRDPALSALAAYRWRKSSHTGGAVLAFIDCDATLHSSRVLAGARREADYLGYRIDHFPLPNGAAGQARLARMLFHRGIRGLLFGPANHPCRFEGWDWENFAPVALDALAHNPPLHAVAMDYFYGSRTAVEHLRRLGCERIGLAIREDLEARTDHRWIGGGLASTPELPVFRGALSPRRLRRWARDHRLDGVITIHRDVHATLQPLGVRSVFLNSFDCPPGAPRLVLDSGTIGSEGVRLVHHALLRGELGLPQDPKTVTLRGRWTTESSRGEAFNNP